MQHDNLIFIILSLANDWHLTRGSVSVGHHLDLSFERINASARHFKEWFYWPTNNLNDRCLWLKVHDTDGFDCETK